MLKLRRICGLAGWLARKGKNSYGYMLGPVLLLVGLNTAEVAVPKMPLSLLQMAQLVIGIYIGRLLQKGELHLSKKYGGYAFLCQKVFLSVLLMFYLL
ncbi:AbrB family transcriptional regulator OS=Lysinibacillus sphaericus OX=1421 GN=LS41612_15805 PE=4 SV=1 [Lysinibacillus sphaericus]